MIKDQAPLPPETEPAVAALIHRLRGTMELMRLQLSYMEQTVESLLRGGFPPPAPAAPHAANDNGGGKKGGGSGAAVDLMAELDAKWGTIPGLPSDDGEAT